jgi:hypothetical protein
MLSTSPHVSGNSLLKSHKGFNDQKSIGYDFRIARYLAGRRVKKCSDNPKIRQHMMDLSGTYVEEILKASRRIKIAFTKTPIEDLNELVSLLGDQKKSTNLEVNRPPFSILSIIHQAC